MAIRKRSKSKQNIFKQIWKLHSTIFMWLIKWFLRSLLILSRRVRFAKSGFVLPTTVMLLLVVTIVIGALIVRTSSRANQVFAERQENYISNAASPAIDRAKSKLEYLFSNTNSGIPNGVPGQSVLVNLMKPPTSGSDVYTLGGETRLDLDNDGNADNAWFFPADTNGDGQNDATVAYSIIGQVPTNQNELNDQSSTAINTRANNLLVRNTPVFDAANSISSSCPQGQTQEEGWFISNNNSSLLRKNFQINAVVIPNNRTTAASTAYSTLELQQDRQFDRGNKWGAWFRYDLEIFNLPQFNWNGAIHTEGSFFVGDNDNTFAAYLISSPSSCFYSRTASEISLSEIPQSTTQPIPFQGQIVNGSLSTNAMMDNAIPFHFVDQNNQPVTTGTNINISGNTDSVSSSFAGSPSDIALDPIALFTQDISQANTVTNWANVRDTNWQNRQLFTNKRIFNQREDKPYLDDTYRADNRYGPKPTYGKDSSVTIPAGTKVGDPIPTAKTALISNDPISGGQENLGLDGYWERRARLDGLRVIVGQRLELSNPLAPPTGTVSHEARQRRALRDNLAAVQATAIYHQANRASENVTNLPVACLATTAHPGTATTITRSRTFDAFDSSINGIDRALYPVVTDFFTGKGTNGYEFTVHPESDYTSSSALMRSLRNLAYFAGDYQDSDNNGIPEKSGAFPPTQEASGSTVIHPYPEMTKWGNFSNLRRTISLIDSGTTYQNLSPADQSNLNTAACMMGMLAYNLRSVKAYDYSPPNPNLNTLAVKLGNISDNNRSNSDGVDIRDIYSSFNAISPYDTPPEAYIAALEKWQATTSNASERNALAQSIAIARVVLANEQSQRDRSNGFATGYSTNCQTADFPSVGVANRNDLKKLCDDQPKYPILYYLFPTEDHGEDNTTNATLQGKLDLRRRTGTDGTYIKSINSSSTQFKAFNDVDIATIALQPRALADWKLPKAANSFSLPTNTISVSGTGYRVPFIDRGIFNGREMMNVRVLDLDLDLLRRNTLNGDNWLPQKGIVYAFREDAVREDGIARPAATTWANCDTLAEIASTSCRMNANTPKDPPVNSTNGISTKPVDFLPDPDRRPYGFRLRNGADLTRTLPAGIVDNLLRGISFISDNPVYIQGNFNLHSTDGTNNNLEEFTQTLTRNASGIFTNFYTRSIPETRFADPNQDRWRPSEIISDAVTILSNNFCDGSIEDSFTNSGILNALVPLVPYGCGSGNGVSSYLNQNRPSTVVPVLTWSREVTSDLQSPIQIDANGSPIMFPNIPLSYYTFSASISATGKKPLIDASETWVNSIIVSGIVPSRTQQHNGGLYNFPRFIENWGNVPLHISGSLIQLNFSTYATAPWDHEAWEPDGSPTLSSSDVFRYYAPPVRLWGYDVALLKASAGPVARRFVSANNTRSEYYRELPVDDPYIRNLRCARQVGSSNRIDTSASCS